MEGTRRFDTLYAEVSAWEKRDFVTPLRQIQMEPAGDDVALSFGDTEYGINKTGHDHIASAAGIPKDYYSRLRENPALLAENVNYWFGRAPERKMLRTLNGKARALLSDRYQRIDHFDLLQAALPIFSGLQVQGIEMKDCGLTDDRMYIKAAFPKMAGEVKVGDIVQAMLMISNSEIGRGSAKVEAMTFRLACLNGMVTQSGVRRHHVGALYGEDGDIDRYLTDATRIATDKAVIARFRDTITGLASDRTWFDAELAKMREAAVDVSFVEVSELPQRVAKAHSLTDGEATLLLANLLQGDSSKPSRWDVANAVTWAAQRVDGYDRRIELERIGGQVLADKKMWNKIAK